VAIAFCHAILTAGNASSEITCNKWKRESGVTFEIDSDQGGAIIRASAKTVSPWRASCSHRARQFEPMMLG